MPDMHLSTDEREALQIHFREHRPRRLSIFVQQRIEFFSGFVLGFIFMGALAILALVAWIETFS